VPGGVKTVGNVMGTDPVTWVSIAILGIFFFTPFCMP
jgi:hypothetical protein